MSGAVRVATLLATVGGCGARRAIPEGRSAIVAEQATERIVVRAAPERCYSVVTDFEHYPRWASDIKSVQVLDRDDEGRATAVAFRAAAFGRSTSYTLAYDYASAPEKLSWVQTKGDITTRLDGTYVFVAVGEDETEVVYHLVAELRVPIPGFVKRRAEGRIMGTALRNLRDRVESGA